MSTELFSPESVASTAPKEMARRIGMSPKRKAIVEYLRLNGSITLAQATALVGGNVYANQRKHTGALLGVMVRVKILVRTGPGIYELHP